MASVVPNPAELPASIPALVMRAAQLHAGRSVLEDAEQCIDYQDLPRRMLAVTRSLLAAGIEKGDRVALWAPNSIDWILVALGLQAAGAVLVPLNTRMKGPEAADIIARSGARMVFVQDLFLGNDYQAMLAAVRPQTLERIVVMGDAGLDSSNQSLSEFLAAGSTSVTFEQARARAASVSAEDLSDLLFTSGTTGKPKGVMYAHGQSLRAFNEYARIIGMVPGDRYLIVNPFFHSFGYKAGWLTCLLGGATILPQAQFDADEIFHRVAAERITILPGPPTLYLSMLDHPSLATADLSSLRVAVTGASTIPPVLIRRMREELKFDLVTTAYGLTECGGLATICDPLDSPEIIAGTSGKPIPGTELAILDEAGRALAAGKQGEICLRGFHVMQGYFNNPTANAEAIDTDAWLHTGDVGSLDEQGNLRITGRLKDMFIVGGFNCYPAEIEAALIDHPAIAQVAVLGIPDSRMGEVGCACVVLRQGCELGEADLIAWARDRMANYKVPRKVAFYPVLPVNASNKVDKLLLSSELSG